MQTHLAPRNEFQLRYALSLMVAITITAIFCLGYFWEGTSISRYFQHRQEVVRVKDAEVLNYTDAMLFGDAREEVDPNLSLNETASSEEGFRKSQWIRFYDEAILSLLMIAAWLMLVPRLQLVRVSSLLYFSLGLYVLFLSYCTMQNGGSRFSEIAILAHAVRWMSMMALGVWLWSQRPVSSEAGIPKLVVGLLVVGVAVTFISHGAEAALSNPPFVHLLSGGFDLISLRPFDLGSYPVPG